MAVVCSNTVWLLGMSTCYMKVFVMHAHNMCKPGFDVPLVVALPSNPLKTLTQHSASPAACEIFQARQDMVDKPRVHDNRLMRPCLHQKFPSNMHGRHLQHLPPAASCLHSSVATVIATHCDPELCCSAELCHVALTLCCVMTVSPCSS